MAKVEKKILKRELSQNGRIVWMQTKSHHANSLLVAAGLNTTQSARKDSKNKRLARLFYCKTNLEVNEVREMATQSCQRRACISCARYRGFLQRQAYVKSIIEIGMKSEREKNKVGGEGAWYLVTLTSPTVFFDKLSQRIDRINEVWRKIYNKASKKKCKYYLNGLRTLEVTTKGITIKMLDERMERYKKAAKSKASKKSAELTELLQQKIREIEDFKKCLPKLKSEVKNARKDGNIFNLKKENKELRKMWQENAHKVFTYHPHLHLLIQGRNNADWLIQEWLKYFPDALSKSQQKDKVGEGKREWKKEVNGRIKAKLTKMLFEVTKYVTKTIASTSEMEQDLTFEYAAAINFVHDTLYKKKTFAAFGKVKKSTEEEMVSFFDECKDKGLYDEVDEIQDLEKVIKREPYKVNEDRTEWISKSGKWDQKICNYRANHLDKQTGELQEIRLAKSEEFNIDKDVDKNVAKLYKNKAILKVDKRVKKWLKNN